MNIKSVKIHNILSIEDAYVEFDDSGLMLVEGWNHDDQRANGAGKSAIFNAITFALFDKMPRKVTATEILRRGTKTGFVEVVLEAGGSEYIVRRSRPKNVSFIKDSVAVPQMTQQEWESIIRLSYSQFLIAAYCAQGASSRFLALNDADKKTFLLQLLNLDEFSNCKKIADETVKALTVDLTTVGSKIASITSRIDAYSESLIDENVYNAAIGSIKERLAHLAVELNTAHSVNAPNLDKFTRLEEDVAVRRSELTRVKARREMLHEQYRKLNAQIKPFDGDDSCHFCGATLDLTAAKNAHEHDMRSKTIELTSIKEQIDSCDAILTKEAALNDLANKIRRKKNDESREYEAAIRRASDLQSKIAIAQQELNSLTLKLENNSELLNKIKVLSKAHTELLSQKGALEHKIELYKSVSAMYSPTGAQAYILDSVVDSFNREVLGYVNLLWPNVSYELRSYKESNKGETTAKFSEILTMNGKDVSIGSLSGGEYRALSLCVDFALIRVMEQHFGLSVNPVVLDEPFDGLDAVGRELIIGLLEELAKQRQIIVIDHASEVKSMFSKVISVDKRAGISTVNLQI